MEDKFQTYYSLFDIYDKNKSKSLIIEEEKWSLEINLLKAIHLINVAFLKNNLEFIIK